MGRLNDDVGFDAYLRDAIRAAGYNSPSQFARAVRLDPSVVLRWLSGTQRPSVASLERVAPALGRRTSDLVRAAYPDRVPEMPRAAGQAQPAIDTSGVAISEEIGRLLALDSPIPAAQRQALIDDLDRILEPYRHALGDPSTTTAHNGQNAPQRQHSA